MIIRRYSCKRFAGLKDKSIDFEANLNVILGPNEAGKSTVVEGLYAVLFKSSKLGYRTKEDKEFRCKFMPLVGGDSIDGQVTVAHSSGDFEISKEWGTEPSFQLTTPGCQVLKDEKAINEALQDVVMFGEGTYSSIVFTKQQFINSAIERIMENRDATSEVGSLLRKTIMELDGVSLEDLRQKIDAEINSLLKRWDVERDCPENNRGIANPYKVGYGEVLDSFYKKENLRLAIKEAVDAEEKFQEAYGRLQEAESKISTLKAKKEAMEAIEEDVIQRAVLEPKVNQLINDMDTLGKINREWPQSELRIKQLETEINTINDNYSRLEAEKLLAGKVAEKNALELRLANINGFKASLAKAEKELSGVRNITREDIQTLEKTHRTMLTAEAKMQAGIMLGRLNQLTAGTELLVTSDLGEPVRVVTGEDFDAKGYLKIVGTGHNENLFEIELKSGDIDFNELRDQYARSKTELEHLLQALGAASIEAAKVNKETRDRLKREAEGYEDQISRLLESDTYEGLMEKLEGCGDLSQVKPLAEIEHGIKEVNDQRIKVISEKKTLEGTVEKWCQEYGTVEGLLDKILEVRAQQNKVKEQIDKLAPLPEGYASSEDFRRALLTSRTTYEEARVSQTKAQEAYFECERSLPELTFEELSNLHEDEELRFRKKLKQGRTLLKIREVFETTRDKMDEASFNPVIESFSKYLAQMTNEAYKVSALDDDFNLTLVRDEQLEMPVELLSSGTYDSVALALRLAILENILGDNQGFVVLDDCLVDLDPYRKEKAAEIIKEFAQKHQVIFVTCSPDTAKLLGGNLITMSTEM